MDRPEDGRDRLRLAARPGRLRGGVRLRAHYLGLRLAAGAQHRRLLLALGGQDRRLLGALRRQDRGALVPVGAHLLLHRALDGRGRLDRLELHPADPQAPPSGRLVKLLAQLAVDEVPRSEGGIQVHAADHVPQRGHRQLLDGGHVVGDFVRRRLRVRHLEVDHRVDPDHQVVLGDDGLRREAHHLLAQVDERSEPVDERRHQVQARVQGPVVAPEPLHDARRGLGNDPHRPDHGDDRQANNQDKKDNRDYGAHHRYLRPRAPIRPTVTRRRREH